MGKLLSGIRVDWLHTALITVTFKRNGGIYEWELTLPKAYEAIYVSGSDL